MCLGFLFQTLGFIKQKYALVYKGQEIMIQRIWEKKLFAVIQMHPEDVCDTEQPLPMLIQFSWNHYVGFYYETIIDFFMSYAPFPFKPEDFSLFLQATIKKQNKEEEAVDEKEQKSFIRIMPEEIVSHLFQKHSLDYEEPIKLMCKFRSIAVENNQNIDLQRHFKNNLKASTAIRYGKYGAARLTVQMSNKNVESMYEGFVENSLDKFMGSYNFEEDENLGFSFLIHNGDKIPIRIIVDGFQIERGCQKQKMLSDFFSEIFQEEFQKMQIRVHGVRVPTFNVKVYELQKYCHPDGFLYFHI